MRDLRIKCASKNATHNDDLKGKTVKMGDRVPPNFGVRFGDHLGIILNRVFFSSGLGIMVLAFWPIPADHRAIYPVYIPGN